MKLSQLTPEQKLEKLQQYLIKLDIDISVGQYNRLYMDGKLLINGDDEDAGNLSDAYLSDAKSSTKK